MYSGQISVSEDQIVPLVHAARSLAIKGLLDVPVPNPTEDIQTKPETHTRPPHSKKPKIKLETGSQQQLRPERSETTCDINADRDSVRTAGSPERATVSGTFPLVIVEDDNSFDDDDGMENIESDRSEPELNIQNVSWVICIVSLSSLCIYFFLIKVSLSLYLKNIKSICVLQKRVYCGGCKIVHIFY